jgi:lipopolysaccharide/colanic/teichoic acid biosynthesis glycosyltransferase
LLKRAFDVVAAGVALMLLLPVLLLIAAAIRLDSPGPAIFRQVRVGRNGREFRILKFRSMRPPGSAPVSSITVAGDARITRVGRWVRNSKLDELPQLWNVLKGEMSLVGPRPEVPEYVSLYPEEVRREVLSVRPGITDHAAIVFRDENELLARAKDPRQEYISSILPRKLALYQQYVRTRTFVGDIAIILRTCMAVLR